MRDQGGVRARALDDQGGTYAAVLVCWGAGATNTGIEPNYGQAVPASGSVFTQISAGLYHPCAMRAGGTGAVYPGGTLVCWGAGTTNTGTSVNYGQAIPPVADTFTQISAGGFHTCGVKTNGTLGCWGNNVYGQATPPAGDATYVQVSAGYDFTCALKTDGTPACWGDNSYGQLNSIPAGTFTQIAAAAHHTCAIKTNGTLACWGNDGGSSGQLVFPSGTFTQISANAHQACGVRTDGTLACWGDNSIGQAPVLSITPSTLPDGAVGAAYSETLIASGGTGPYIFTLQSGSLPARTTLSTGGTLSGTTSVNGVYGFSVQAVDANSIGAQQAVTVTIVGGPVVTAAPSDQTVSAGTVVALTASASGTPTPAVQWQLLVRGSGTWIVVAGATATTHTFTASATSTLNQYRAVFTNVVGTATTSGALLTVRPTDDPIQAGFTVVKAVHITELRSLIDSLRARYGLRVFQWADSTIVTGATIVSAAHITDLRAALADVYAAAVRTAPTYGSAIVPGASVIAAVHIAELRTAVAAIW